MKNSVLQKLGTLGSHFTHYLFTYLFMGHLAKLLVFQNIALDGRMFSE
jgi:hypothetical protein